MRTHGQQRLVVTNPVPINTNLFTPQESNNGTYGALPQSKSKSLEDAVTRRCGIFILQYFRTARGKP